MHLDVFYVLYFMYCILCIVFYVLYFMYCILCICFMYCILCIVFYVIIYLHVWIKKKPVFVLFSFIQIAM